MCMSVTCGKAGGDETRIVQSGIIDLGSSLSVTNLVIARAAGAVMVRTITRVMYSSLPLKYTT